MYRDKTIIRLRKEPKTRKLWQVKKGNNIGYKSMGISRLFRLIATLVQDKGDVYSIDVVIKRKK